MYVYAEYLLIENLIINYIILYVTKRFTRTDTSNLRVFIAALIGALYTLIVLIPSFNFLANFLIKIIVSVLLIIVAFNPIKLKKLVKLFATFYTVSFVFAGASLALFYLTNSKIFFGKGIFYIKEFPLKILIVGIVVAWILFKITFQLIQSKISKQNMYVSFTIKLQERKVKVLGLVDTGNSLKEPISNIPVIVVEFSAIKDILPVSIQTIFTKYNENNLNIISEIMSNSDEHLNFRLIPFKSIGKENGMLLGFKPDEVILEDETKQKIQEIVIGIYNNHLTSDNDYSALLNPELIN